MDAFRFPRGYPPELLALLLTCDAQTSLFAEILRALRHDAAERDLVRFLLVRDALAYACTATN